MKNFVTYQTHESGKELMWEEAIKLYANANNKGIIIFNAKKIEKEYSKPEEWRTVIIRGMTTRYRVSNLGRVFDSERMKFVVPVEMNKRYFVVSLYLPNKTQIMITLHRLVALTFIKIPKDYIKAGYYPKDLVVNHIDGQRWHNTVENLEWCTYKENMYHAQHIADLNRGIFGENSHLAKITEAQAIKICELLQSGKTMEQTANEVCVSKKIVQHIRAGESWKEISRKYKFPRLGKAIPNTIPIETIHNICKMLEEKKYSDSVIARQFGVTREYVRDIRMHKRQKEIGAKYNF